MMITGFSKNDQGTGVYDPYVFAGHASNPPEVLLRYIEKAIFPPWTASQEIYCVIAPRYAPQFPAKPALAHITRPQHSHVRSSVRKLHLSASGNSFPSDHA